MSRQQDDDFSARIRAQLDRHAGAVDELTAARLRALRKQALEQAPRRNRRGGLGAGLAALAAGLLVAVVWWRVLPPEAAPLTLDADTLAQIEDMELLEELEFYAWLEATGSSS